MTALKHIVALGDSQTDDLAGFGVDAFDMWPATLQRSLRADGHEVRVHSFGKSGDTTAQALARVADCFWYGRPACAILYIGVNDPGNAITQAQTQANLQATIKALKHRAIGDGLSSGPTVAGQATLPANGKLGDRYVVLNDTSTTGGAPSTDPAHHPTITGTIAGQTVWEFRAAAEGELGWGRVATNTTAPLIDRAGAPLGCDHITVVSTNYLNFTTGGDTPTTPYAAYANVRSAQQAAATAENGNGAVVAYADLYGAQKALIHLGRVPDFSTTTYAQTKSWHYRQDNQHHNAFGHGHVANVVRPTAAAALV